MHLAGNMKVRLVWQSALEHTTIILYKIIVHCRLSRWPLWILQQRLHFHQPATSNTETRTNRMHVNQPAFPLCTLRNLCKAHLLIHLTTYPRSFELFLQLRPIVFTFWRRRPGRRCSSSPAASAPSPTSTAISTTTKRASPWSSAGRAQTKCTSRHQTKESRSLAYSTSAVVERWVGDQSGNRCSS
jgi:hypothetical protein